MNRPDILQREGNYAPPPGGSDILGLEVAGEVVAMGAGDSGPWRIGDPLCALVAGGGYAEYCAVPAPQALPVPKGLDPRRGGGGAGDLLHGLDQRLPARGG